MVQLPQHKQAWPAWQPKEVFKQRAFPVCSKLRLALKFRCLNNSCIPHSKTCFGSHLCPKLTWDFELDCSQSDCWYGYPHPFVIFVNSPEASMISLWTSVCRGADNDQHLRKFQAGVASFLTLGGSKKSYTASKGTVKVKHWMSQGLSQHQAWTQSYGRGIWEYGVCSWQEMPSRTVPIILDDGILCLF